MEERDHTDIVYAEFNCSFSKAIYADLILANWDIGFIVQILVIAIRLEIVEVINDFLLDTHTVVSVVLKILSSTAK